MRCMNATRTLLAGGVLVAAFVFLRGPNMDNAAPAVEPEGGNANAATTSALPSSPSSMRSGEKVEVKRTVMAQTKFGTVEIPTGSQVTFIGSDAARIRARFGEQEVSFPNSAFVAPAATIPPQKPSAEFSQFSKFLLIVEGDAGRASGAVLNFRGSPLITTNVHVLAGNKWLTIRGLDSRVVRPIKLLISKNSDIAVATQAEMKEGLPIMENVEVGATIGDEVMVLGNSLGESVATEIRGTITGIGPELVEVDAKFVEGNSGSPIIHVKTGTVIALATFAEVRTLSPIGKDSKFTEVRRFGYRLDTAKTWDSPSWGQFVQEGETFGRMKAQSKYLIAIAIDILDDGRIDYEKHQDHANPLRDIVTEYSRALKHASKQDVTSAKQRFIRGLMLEARKDYQTENFSGFTSWHQIQIQQEVEFRKLLRDKFQELTNIQDAERTITLK